MAFEEKSRPQPAEEQAPAPDVIRSLLGTMVQEALRAEFDRFVGAAPYERTPERRGQRNGSYPRTLKTRVGAMTLAIPRDRAGLFRPTLFAKYERSEQALVLAMIEMYFHGVSTRKVNAIVEQLCGTTISASEVSALSRKLDATLTAWRERRLTETPYAALVVDARIEQVRREGHVRATAALWVVGVTPEGYREHLGDRVGQPVRPGRAVSAGDKGGLVDVGVFDYDAVVFGELWKRCGRAVFEGYLRYYMSDHRPMWVRLRPG